MDDGPAWPRDDFSPYIPTYNRRVVTLIARSARRRNVDLDQLQLPIEATIHSSLFDSSQSVIRSHTGEVTFPFERLKSRWRVSF